MQARQHTLRFCGVLSFFILSLIVFIFKLTYIQIFRSEHLSKLASRQHNYMIDLEPIRGTIYDRQLRPLAFNVTAASLYANPRIMGQADKDKAVAELPALLGVSADFIQSKLSKNKYFVWVERKLPQEKIKRIKALKIKGIGFRKESKRFYPNQSLAAHVVGFAGIDNQGLEGIELQYDHFLKGKEGWAQILRDARQRELLIEKSYLPPEDGFNIVLTIDETIQFLAERALDKAFQKHNAKWATIIVMDPKTGEILALANRPTYDVSQVEIASIESRTNRALSYTYEPGSVFKIVTAAAALQEGTFKEVDKIDCENGSYRVGSHILHDAHPKGILTFQQVIEESSNIGTTKIAQKLGPTTFFKYADKFRFGHLTGIDLKGEVDGVLKNPSVWSKTSIAAVPIGQEVTVTPLQLVAAIAAIANDGVYMKPFVVKYLKDNNNQIIRSFEPQIIDQVITVETSKRLKDILIGVVQDGTGKKAQIKGVSVAGKTGTSQKVVDGLYSHSKFFASFIGFAPAEDPQIAIVVVVDEPHPSYYGGTVAAPVFQEVAEDTLKYLQTVANPIEEYAIK
ncbi:MAG: hypothetical protein A2Z88_08015 [Omnitrophica WOR_2 bacterium GWA2_47_8]|nr:MAG: hypothetical protein A2Z88_08015 [Omnitrophica WOR_2 bacterium GWA2_47_8]